MYIFGAVSDNNMSPSNILNCENIMAILGGDDNPSSGIQILKSRIIRLSTMFKAKMRIIKLLKRFSLYNNSLTLKKPTQPLLQKLTQHLMLALLCDLSTQR